MKLVETIGIQKKVLEEENEELKSRISELMNERSGYNSTSPIIEQNMGAMRQGVPMLNFGTANGGAMWDQILEQKNLKKLLP